MTSAPALEVIPQTHVAYLPLAPRNAEYPKLTRDPAIADMHLRMVRLHYLAFVALYGPPPNKVRVRSIYAGQISEPLQPMFAARALDRAPCPEALVWLDAFAHGLDAWSEAEFASPFVLSQGRAGRLHISMQTLEQSVQGACERLARAGRARELANLKAEFPVGRPVSWGAF